MSNPLDDMLAVCDTIHGENRFLVQLLSPDAYVLKFRDAFSTTVNELEDHVDAYDQLRFEVLMTVGAVGRRPDRIIHTSAVAVDFDNGVPPLLKNPLLRPTIIIRTSPGHSHAIWTLEEKITHAKAEALSLSLATRLGGNLASARANMMIRLPGFLHGKYGENVRLMPQTNLSRTFQYDWLRSAIEIDPAWTPERQKEHLLSLLERQHEATAADWTS